MDATSQEPFTSSSSECPPIGPPDERRWSALVEDHRRCQAELVRHERMAMMTRLVGRLAYEINDPLQVVLGEAESLLEGGNLTGVTPQDRIAEIHAHALRIGDVVGRLQMLARQRELQKTVVAVADVLHRAVARRQDALAASKIRLVCDWSGTESVIADQSLLEEACTQLVANAEEAMRAEGGGVLTISVRSAAGRVLMAFEDTGPGIALEHRERIFEPFYTTKRSTHGTGLGLAICLGIILEHGGALRVLDSPSGGAAFVIDIAAAPGAAGADAAIQSRQRSMGTESEPS